MATHQSRAMSVVYGAVSRGELSQLDGSILCADCGKPATVYDHRDYLKPLEVEPVCNSCNHKRGTAANHDRDPECRTIRIKLHVEEWQQITLTAIHNDITLLNLLTGFIRDGLRKSPRLTLKWGDDDVTNKI